MALWPVAGKPVLERLLDHLANEGLTHVVVCCNEDTSALVERLRPVPSLTVTLMIEDLACGTAGCLRNALVADPGDLVLVFSGSIVAPPPVESLIAAHLAGEAELTVMFNPDGSDVGTDSEPAEIYVCRPNVLRDVPRGGYADIKEGLIPSILRVGGTVHPAVLPEAVGNFHDRPAYLGAVSLFLDKHVAQRQDVARGQPAIEGIVSTASGALVHTKARIHGPVVIGDGARIMEDAVVVGPATVGREAVIGPGSVVVRSSLWQRTRVGAHCKITESVLGDGAVVSEGTVVSGRSVSAEHAFEVEGLVVRVTERVKGSLSGLGQRMRSHLDGFVEKRPAWAAWSSTRVLHAIGLAAVLLSLLWAYWPTLTDLWRVWLASDEYSAGLLVPFLTLYVLWARRGQGASLVAKPSVFGGLVLFLMAQAGRGFALYFMYSSAERLSLVLSIVALVVLLLGWQFLRKLAPVLLFLCLMLPWPNRVQAALALPLQRWATDSAVFCLELAGYEIVQDGNVIHIGDASVAVAEACNGLRMITAFFVISGLVVLLVKRAWWEKLIVLVSSLPIALLCNTLRLTITSIAFTVIDGDSYRQMFHDYGGFAMMPLALAIVVAELWLLTLLTTSPTEIKPVVIARRKPRHVPGS